MGLWHGDRTWIAWGRSRSSFRESLYKSTPSASSEETHVLSGSCIKNIHYWLGGDVWSVWRTHYIWRGESRFISYSLYCFHMRSLASLIELSWLDKPLQQYTSIVALQPGRNIGTSSSCVLFAPPSDQSSASSHETITAVSVSVHVRVLGGCICLPSCNLC